MADKEPEPSMDDILSSIRQIITENKDDNDEDTAPAGAELEQAIAEMEVSGDDEPLTLTEMVQEDGSIISLEDESAPAITNDDIKTTALDTEGLAAALQEDALHTDATERETLADVKDEDLVANATEKPVMQTEALAAALAEETIAETPVSNLDGMDADVFAAELQPDLHTDELEAALAEDLDSEPQDQESAIAALEAAMAEEKNKVPEFDEAAAKAKLQAAFDNQDGHSTELKEPNIAALKTEDFVTNDQPTTDLTPTPEPAPALTAEPIVADKPDQFAVDATNHAPVVSPIEQEEDSIDNANANIGADEFIVEEQPLSLSPEFLAQPMDDSADTQPTAPVQEPQNISVENTDPIAEPAMLDPQMEAMHNDVAQKINASLQASLEDTDGIQQDSPADLNALEQSLEQDIASGLGMSEGNVAQHPSFTPNDAALQHNEPQYQQNQVQQAPNIVDQALPDQNQAPATLEANFQAPHSGNDAQATETPAYTAPAAPVAPQPLHQDIPAELQSDGLGSSPVSPNNLEKAVNAFADLAHVAEQESAITQMEETVADQVGKNLDDIVHKTVSPMLHEWLDQNLSDIVERVVREEVERIAAMSRKS